jgi:hypothetical protein
MTKLTAAFRNFVKSGYKYRIFKFASKETELEGSGDKTEYMVMSGDQNAGRSDSTDIDNNSFERVEQFKYFGTNLTNQNSIPE